MRIRNRFFAVFLRDRFNIVSPANQQIIKNGNQNTHTGNASVDALLFEGGVREDTGTFVLLYGVMPKIV